MSESLASLNSWLMSTGSRPATFGVVLLWAERPELRHSRPSIVARERQIAAPFQTFAGNTRVNYSDDRRRPHAGHSEFMLVGQEGTVLRPSLSGGHRLSPDPRTFKAGVKALDIFLAIVIPYLSVYSRMEQQ